MIVLLWYVFCMHFIGSQQQPKTVLEALNQRLEKYKSAAAQAKANGDGRKSRMHERIAKVKNKNRGGVQLMLAIVPRF